MMNFNYRIIFHILQLMVKLKEKIYEIQLLDKMGVTNKQIKWRNGKNKYCT